MDRRAVINMDNGGGGFCMKGVRADIGKQEDLEGTLEIRSFRTPELKVSQKSDIHYCVKRLTEICFVFYIE